MTVCLDFTFWMSFGVISRLCGVRRGIANSGKVLVVGPVNSSLRVSVGSLRVRGEGEVRGLGLTSLTMRDLSRAAN